MKKIAISLVIVLIIFNFICSNCFVYAEAESMSVDDYKRIADEGVVNEGGTERKLAIQDNTLLDTQIGTPASTLGTFFTTTAAIISKTISDFTNEGGFYYTESKYAAKETGIFTIQSLIFGEYLLFNSKAYQRSTDLNSSITPSKVVELVDGMKENGAAFGRFFSRFALAIALPLTMVSLVKTIGARKAADLAVWKKILVRWALCVFLIIFYSYILAVIDTAADSLVDTFWNMRIQLEEADYKAFEPTIVTVFSQMLISTGGITYLAYAILFAAFVLVQCLFIIKYAIRTLAIIFLFIFAPVFILIHSVNLMLGKESDTLGEFFKNYIALVFMQPVHALFYIIFFFSLSEIAIKAPFFGIFLLYALYRAGNIAKAMFGWELGKSIFTLKG